MLLEVQPAQRTPPPPGPSHLLLQPMHAPHPTPFALLGSAGRHRFAYLLGSFGRGASLQNASRGCSTVRHPGGGSGCSCLQPEGGRPEDKNVSVNEDPSRRKSQEDTQASERASVALGAFAAGGGVGLESPAGSGGNTQRLESQLPASRGLPR